MPLMGRYGNDQLNVALFIGSLIVEIVGSILNLRVIYYIGLAMFLWSIFRMFSRNIPARTRENQAFVNFRNRFANWRYFRQLNRQEKANARAQKRYARAEKKNSRSAGNRQGGAATYDFEREKAARENRRAAKKGGTIYCYYYCPQCKQQVRIPAGRGKVRITCPRCGNQFESYS